MLNIKMEQWVIAVDLDRCLLNSSNKLSNENRNALAKAFSSGAMIMIASGRMLPAMQIISEQLPPVAALVALNGALVLDNTRGTILLEVVLPHAQVLALSRWATEHNCQMILCCLESIYVTLLDPIVEEYTRRTQVSVNVGSGIKKEVLPTIYKALIYRCYPELTNETMLVNEMRHSEAFPICTLYKSDHGYIEVVPVGVAKDKGLQVALAARGLQHLPFMAVGDGENDIAMLRLADCGYAVANASADVQAAADIVVSDCDNNGVAEAITHFTVNLVSQGWRKGLR